MARTYEQLINVGGEIRAKDGRSYATEAELAQDLGVAPHDIEWGRIPKQTREITALKAEEGDPGTWADLRGKMGAQVASDTPLTRFNYEVMKMLKDSQGLGTAKFSEAASLARQKQAGEVMKEADPDLPPHLQAAIRSGRVGAVSPEITGAERMGQTFGEQIRSFKDVMTQSQNIAQSIENSQRQSQMDERDLISKAFTMFGGSVFDKLDPKEIDIMEKTAGYPKGFLTEMGKTLKEQELAIKTGDGLNIYEGLNPSQQLQAGNLSVKIFGKRAGMKPENVSKITTLMRQGQTMDNIEDMLKYAGQSEQFSGVIRDAAESIASNYTSDAKRQQLFDTIDRSMETGNVGRVKDLLKKSAVDSLGVDDAKVVRGKARTVEFLEEIREDLYKYEEGGGKTNIFTGTAEDIAKAVGTVKDAELRRIATKIMTAIQSYRRSMSGVAFSVPESKEYQSMFPSIGQTKDFNMANINALQEVFNGDLEFTYKFLMGEEAYISIFEEEGLSISTIESLESLWGDEGGEGDLFDFSSSGSGNTYSYKEGEKFGQCGRLVNQITGLGVGDSYASKMAKMDKSIKAPSAGMVFLMPYSTTGHTGIILSVDNKGMATVKDSNWKLDERILTHKIPVSKMTGFAYINKLA